MQTALLSCTYTQTLTFGSTSRSTSATHLFQFVLFDVPEQVTALTVEGPNQATYVIPVSTTTREYSDDVTETFTVSDCTALDDGVVQYDSDGERSVRIQCTENVTPSITLHLEWTTTTVDGISSASSEAFSVSLFCFPTASAPVFTVQTMPTTETEGTALVTITSSCPSTCSESLKGYFMIFSVLGEVTEELLTLDCATADTAQSLTLTVGASLQVCAYHQSFTDAPLCTVTNVSFIEVGLVSFTATPSRSGFVKDPSRTLTAVLSLSDEDSSLVSSVFLTGYTSESFKLTLSACADGECTYTVIATFNAGSYSLSLSATVSGVTLTFPSPVAAFECEAIGTISVVSAADPNYQIDEFDLKMTVNWGTETSTHTLTSLSVSCKDDDNNTGNGSVTILEEQTYSETSSSTTLDSVSVITKSALGFTETTKPLYCSWSCTVSNQVNTATATGVFYLNSDVCVEIATISPPQNFAFAVPSSRDERCFSITPSQTKIVIVDESTASWERTSTNLSCSNDSETFKVTYNDPDSDSSLSFGVDNAPFTLSGLSSSVTSLYICHKTTTRSSEALTLSDLSFCSASFATPSAFISVPSSGSNVVLIDVDKFYITTDVTDTITVHGMTADPCHESLFSYQTTIGDTTTKTAVVSYAPGTSSFTVNSSWVYCGAGFSDEQSSGVVSKTFTNCLSGLVMGTTGAFSFTFGSVVVLYPTYGLYVAVSSYSSEETNCGLTINYVLSYSSASVASELVAGESSDYFLLKSIYNSLDTGQKQFTLSASIGTSAAVDNTVSLTLCKLAHPTLSALKIKVVASDDSRSVVASWSSSASSSTCERTCVYYLTSTVNGAAQSMELSSSTTSYTIADVADGNAVAVSVQSRCDTPVSGQYDSSTALSYTISTICIPTKPTISAFSCTSCKYYNGKYFAYKSSLSLTLAVSAIGNVCSGDYYDPSISNYLKFVFGESKYTNATVKSSYSFTLGFTPSSSSSSSEPTVTTSLTLNGFSIDIPITLSYCIVSTPVIHPSIKNGAYVYQSLESDSFSYVVSFTGATQFYSTCFDGGHYELEYWTQTDPIVLVYSDSSGAPITVAAEESLTSGTLTFVVSKAQIYYYRIVGVSAVGERLESSSKVLHLCSSSSIATPPELLSPMTQDNANVTVLNPVFSWSVPDETLAIRCSAAEDVYLVFELVEESQSFTNDTAVISTALSLLATETELSSDYLLALSTTYQWRVTVYYFAAGSTEPDETFISDIQTFTTVAQHCSYVNCNHGNCDDESVTCECYTGYRGDYCDQSGLGSTAIAGIAASVAVITVLCLVGAFIVLKRANVLGLRMPNFKMFMFSLPKHICDSDTPSSPELVQEIVKNDAANQFAWAIALFNQTSVTESDMICRAVVYSYERFGQGLNLILRLIEFEVEDATHTSTLFRNNSTATKCFKVYSRMVGLPYLYRVLYPLLDKLIKDEQRSQAGVKLSGGSGLTKGMSVNITDSYELNPTAFDEGKELDDGSLETNAFAIQYTCQLFLDSINKTTSHCPQEFCRVSLFAFFMLFSQP
jgi:hypothetical protein